ncbi:MAG: hypothetical protein K6G63_06770 [Eubacterium sp.]|nr:hypothetical protein [Eubacterium sp.]
MRKFRIYTVLMIVFAMLMGSVFNGNEVLLANSLITVKDTIKTYGEDEVVYETEIQTTSYDAKPGHGSHSRSKTTATPTAAPTDNYSDDDSDYDYSDNSDDFDADDETDENTDVDSDDSNYFDDDTDSNGGDSDIDDSEDDSSDDTSEYDYDDGSDDSTGDNQANIDYSDESENTESDPAYDAIYNGILDMETSINLSSYKITRSELNALLNTMFRQEPDLYFLDSSYSTSYSNTTGYVVYLEPTYLYSKDEVASMNSEIELEANKILSGIQSSWSNLERVIYIHDKLITSSEYDTSDNPSRNIYGLLVEKKAVCVGYTLAFIYLMEKLGIPAVSVPSDEMGHIWNQVKINGNWYNMDMTFDDPVPNIPGGAYHKNMLISDALAKTTDGCSHYSWTSDYTCKDTTYDSAPWRDSYAPITFANGKWYYISGNVSNSAGIYTWDPETNDSTLVKSLSGVRWYVSGSTTQYYTKIYSGLLYNDGLIIYNTQTAIKAFYVTAPQTTYTINTDVDDGIWGITLVDGVLYANVGSSYSSFSNTAIGRLASSTNDNEGTIDSTAVTPAPTAAASDYSSDSSNVNPPQETAPTSSDTTITDDDNDSTDVDEDDDTYVDDADSDTGEDSDNDSSNNDSDNNSSSSDDNSNNSSGVIFTPDDPSDDGAVSNNNDDSSKSDVSNNSEVSSNSEVSENNDDLDDDSDDDSDDDDDDNSTSLFKTANGVVVANTDSATSDDADDEDDDDEEDEDDTDDEDDDTDSETVNNSTNKIKLNITAKKGKKQFTIKTRKKAIVIVKLSKKIIKKGKKAVKKLKIKASKNKSGKVKIKLTKALKKGVKITIKVKYQNTSKSVTKKIK